MKTMVLAGAVALGLSTGAAFASTSPSGDVSTDATPARISRTLAGAGLVLAAPTGFRPLPIHPVLAAARKPVGTTMPYAIIPQQCAKSGLARLDASASYRECTFTRDVADPDTVPPASGTRLCAERHPICPPSTKRGSTAAQCA